MESVYYQHSTYTQQTIDTLDAVRRLSWLREEARERLLVIEEALRAAQNGLPTVQIEE